MVAYPVLMRDAVESSRVGRCPHDRTAGAAVSVESLKNVSGYKGTLRKVIAWQEQEKTLANIKATRMQKNLTAAACEEKVVALTLDDKRREQQESATAKAQKAVDDIAVQCWLRHKLAE